MKKIRLKPALALLAFALFIGALAAWGPALGMTDGALHWVYAAAGLLGVAIMSLLPALLADKNGDGIPDAIEETTETTATVVQTTTTTEKK